MVVNNGNRLRCEIKNFKDNKIVCKTTNFGTVSIKWDRVDHIVSKNEFRVELRNGMLLVGSLDSTEVDKVVRIFDNTEQLWTEVPTKEIVGIYKINQTIFSRIDGNLGIGYSFTKSSNIHSVNGKFGLSYLTKKNLLQFSGNGIYTLQSDTITTSKTDLELSDQQLFRNNWFFGISWLLQQNSELGIAARNIASISYGKYLIKENQMFLKTSLGVAINNERYYIAEDGNQRAPQYNYEGVFSLDYRAFTNNDPEFNFHPSWVLYPSFSQPGRVRSEVNLEGRFELYNDIFFSLTYYNQFDNRPPESGTEVDYGIICSLDWIF